MYRFKDYGAFFEIYGPDLDQQKDLSLFLDEMSLTDAWQVNLSRLKIKTRIFVEQGLGQNRGNYFTVYTKNIIVYISHPNFADNTK